MTQNRDAQSSVSQPINRKQLSRSQRDAYLQQRILMAAGGVLGLALIILIIGAVKSYVIDPNQPVARIHGQTITTRDYQQRVNFDRWQLLRAIGSVQAQAEQLPPDDPSVDFVRQIYQQQAQRLQQQYAFAGTQALEEVIETELIRQKAQELGITVTDEEVTVEIERQVARGVGAVRPTDATATATAGVAATETAVGFTPTATFEPTPTLNPTESAAITQTATPMPPTGTPEPTPTPSYLTTETFTQQYQDYLKELEDQTGYTDAQYREFIRTNLLRQKLEEHFATQVPTEEEQVKALQVVYDTEAEAQAALAELNSGNTDFTTLIQTQAARTAGDLGFFTRDQMVEEFSEMAFTLEPGQISDPVQTQFGWHIIQVQEKDEEGDRVRARHILVETEEEAQEIKAQLDEGADFGTLVLEHSTEPRQDTSDLGWLTKQSATVEQAIVDAAFTLTAGEVVTAPITTADNKFALIQVTEGPEVRELDESALEQRKQSAFQDWLTEAKAAEGIERLWDIDKVPRDPFTRNAAF